MSIVNELFGPDASSSVVDDILTERHSQIFGHGFDRERDDQYTRNQLPLAAAAYLVHGTRAERCRAEFADGQTHLVPDAWPHDWDTLHFKPNSEDRRRDLVKAAALVVAEIERIDRARKGQDQLETAVKNLGYSFDEFGVVQFDLPDEGSGQ